MVKKVTASLRLILFCLISWMSTAQTTLREGKLFYDISYQNLSAELQKNEHLLPHDAAFYFKDNKTRMEMGMGSLGKNTTIFNRDTKQSIILLNIYSKKFALIKTDSEMIAARKAMMPDSGAIVKVEVKDDQKKIAGFMCRKALVFKTINGKTDTNECWFTKEIPPFNTENDPNLKAIDGFLMQYSITENGITMVLKVKMVMPYPVDDYLFTIPENYKTVTEADLNRLLEVMQSED